MTLCTNSTYRLSKQTSASSKFYAKRYVQYIADADAHRRIIMEANRGSGLRARSSKGPVAREARSVLPGGKSCVMEHPLLSSLNFNDAIDIFTISYSKVRERVF